MKKPLRIFLVIASVAAVFVAVAAAVAKLFDVSRKQYADIYNPEDEFVPF